MFPSDDEPHIKKILEIGKFQLGAIHSLNTYLISFMTHNKKISNRDKNNWNFENLTYNDYVLSFQSFKFVLFIKSELFFSLFDIFFYYIYSDKIPGFFILPKHHFLIARSESFALRKG